MHMYNLPTEWYFDAPVESVWAVAIEDFLTFPQWWSDYEKVELQNPDQPAGVGSVYDIVVKGSLAYSLKFKLEVTKLELPYLNEHKVWGDLQGTGKWTLEKRDGGTLIVHEWNVGTTNPILNLFARFGFAERMMEKNHAGVMARGCEGIKKRLALQAK